MSAHASHGRGQVYTVRRHEHHAIAGQRLLLQRRAPVAFSTVPSADATLTASWPLSRRRASAPSGSRIAVRPRRCGNFRVTACGSCEPGYSGKPTSLTENGSCFADKFCSSEQQVVAHEYWDTLLLATLA